MILRFFCCIGLFLSCNIKAQVMWQFYKDSVVTWNYKEGDEFNASQLNKDYWNYSYGWARTIYANKEQQYYTEGKNHVLNGSTLKLTARKEKLTEKIIDQYKDNDTIKNNGNFYSLNKTTFNYSAGMIQSKKKFNKGFFECRVKLPKQNGYWPAFWLYGGSPNEEIDMLEGKTERANQIHIDTHCPNRCDLVNLFLQKKSYGGWVKTNIDFTSEYSIIACDWDTEKIRFYLNGECIGVAKVNFDAEKHIVFNIAVPSNNGPFKPGPDANDTTTATYEIDYVRVWNKEANINKPLDGNFMTSIETNKPIQEAPSSKSKNKMTYGEKADHKNEGVFISCFDNQNELQLYSLGIFNTDKPKYVIKDGSDKEVASGIITNQIFNISKSTLLEGKYTLVVSYNGKSTTKLFTKK